MRSKVDKVTLILSKHRYHIN